MKNIIPTPDQLLDDLLSELEQFDEAENTDDLLNKFLDQFTVDLTDEHRELIAVDRSQAAEARANGKKHQSSSLTKCVECFLFRAFQNPDAFQDFTLPPAVADALLRRDEAGIDAGSIVFQCRNCGFFPEALFLESDGLAFSFACPVCGRPSADNLRN